jgi:hypothetical protein
LLPQCLEQPPELRQAEFEFAPMNRRLVGKNVGVAEHLCQCGQFLGPIHLL